jgi:hypothetical protein
LFSSSTPVPVAITATFEGGSGDDSGLFTNVNAGNVVSFTAANHTSGGIKVVRLNQSYKIGPAKSIKVYPGDKVDTEVWAYYEGSSGFGTGLRTVASMLVSLSAAFGGVSGGGGESGSIYNGLNSALGGFGLGGSAGDTSPTAYLNYILFDQNYKVLDMGWQLVPTSANFSKQLMTLPQLSIKEAGYVFVYLSYEGTV